MGRRNKRDGRRDATNITTAKPKTRKRGKRHSIFGALILPPGTHWHVNQKVNP